MAVNRLSQLVRGSLLTILIMLANWSYAEDIFAEHSLRVGFYARAFPDFSAEDLEISVKLLSEEIGKDNGIATTVTVFTDIALMRKEFEQGKINFAVASTLQLANDFDDALLADGFRLVLSSDRSDSLLVLTRKNEGLDNFKPLRGKKLALVEFDPVADLYIDFLARSEFHKSYQAAFKLMPREKKANQIILKLFFGQADVICVYQNAYRLATELNPQLMSKLQIIAQLDGIPQGAGLFNKKTPAEFREQVIALALKLDSHARGQQLLQLFKADKAVRSTLADLAGTKLLYSAYKKLNKHK